METEAPRRTTAKLIGIAAGPLAAAGLWLLPLGSGAEALDPAGRATLSVMAWMALWWLTEAVDLAVTALLPLVLFPLAGAATFRAAAAPYADPLIFLFLGGFVLARAMRRFDVDRRIALRVLLVAGERPDRMIGGLMLVTAGLSMFVSNTATAAMMLPIATSVISLVGGATGPARPGTPERQFAVALLLGVAYSASIGGIGTIIGTPPNALLVGFARESIAPGQRLEIGFARWLLLGLPLVGILLPLAWFLLTRVLFPVRIGMVRGGARFVRERLKEMGPRGRGETTLIAVFLATALAWVARPLLTRWPPLAGLSDAGIAITAAVALFVLPVERGARRFAMDWAAARGLPWDVLLLFGGGLSLAARVQEHGVAAYLGARAAALPALPAPVVVLAVTLVVIFLTELTSNTATTATLLPILAAIAPSLGVDPYLLIVPAALAASCAFMLPVATPPNAIVFGSGMLRIPEMCRAGLWLNLSGAAVITAVTLLLVPLVFGAR